MEQFGPAVKNLQDHSNVSTPAVAQVSPSLLLKEKDGGHEVITDQLKDALSSMTLEEGCL